MRPTSTALPSPDLRPVARQGGGEPRLPDAVEVGDAPIELLERGLGGGAILIRVRPAQRRAILGSGSGAIVLLALPALAIAKNAPETVAIES